MSLCEANSIQLILINPPILCEPNWTLPHQFDHITVIDGMNWEYSESLEYHYDDVHLRGIGAELYSRWIAPQLSRAIQKHP